MGEQDLMYATCDAVGEGLSSAHSALSACTKCRGMLSAASSLHRWFSGKGPCSCSMCQVQAMAVCVRKPLSASLSSISAAKTGIPCRVITAGSASPLFTILGRCRTMPGRWITLSLLMATQGDNKSVIKGLQ